jgi:hypothetical protein
VRTLRFELQLSSLALYNGKHSLWLSLTIGCRTWFLARWDSTRVTLKTGDFVLRRGAEMCWYVGTWALCPATGKIVR